MATASDIQDEATNAVAEFARRTGIILMPGRNPRESLATGVLLRTDGGCPFLLSARHPFDDGEWRPTDAIAPGRGKDQQVQGDYIRDLVDDVQYCPARQGRDGHIDVALVRLRRAVHDTLRPLAAGVETIAGDDDVEPSDVVLLCGFPQFLHVQAPNDPKLFLLSSIAHRTSINGHDPQGRLLVEWNEAIPRKTAPLAPLQEGKLTKLGCAKGISGGAVWRIRGERKESLWAPSSHAKLIGVAVSWNQKDTEYAESVSAWGEWVRSSIPWVEAGMT